VAWESTSEEWLSLVDDKRAEFDAILGREPSLGASRYSDRIDVDVGRTDSMHSFYMLDGSRRGSLRRILNAVSLKYPRIGYCQGMSDLLSTVFIVLGDEAAAFLAFEALLDRVGSHFMDGHKVVNDKLMQLEDILERYDGELYSHLQRSHEDSFSLIAMQWILLWFKREFRSEDILQIWDVIISYDEQDCFEVYLAAAILIYHRSQILVEQDIDQVNAPHALADTPHLQHVHYL